MRREKLIECFNKIPSDVRVEVFGEYNGIGHIEIMIWCGRDLSHDWKDWIDSGEPVDEVLKRCSHDIWNAIAYDEDGEIELVDGHRFNELVKLGREALSTHWDAHLRIKVNEYIANKPTGKQKRFANVIMNALGIKNPFTSSSTKRDYSEFISKNIKSYQEWWKDHNPENYACDDDYGPGPDPEY